MTTEEPSAESPSRKRPRRSKQDPQFIFSNSANDEVDGETTAGNTNKRSPSKTKTKSLESVESVDGSADLYEPGDIVWCKLGGFPWWPALICRCTTEGGIHTKTLNSNNKPKRLFFVYFYGKYLEYSWISTRWLLKYAGLSSFIQDAESAVQQAATKSEQLELANRYQLKVSMKKRVQWDEAIELADHALSITKDERIEEFSDLLKDALDQKKANARRRKTSADKSQIENEEEKGNQRHVRASSVSSIISSLPETNTEEKQKVSLRKPIAFSQNDSIVPPEEGQVPKKKRSRKTKSDIPLATDNNLNNSSSSTVENNPTKKPRTKAVRQSRKSHKTNGDKAQSDESSLTSNRPDQKLALSLVQLIQANNPPLSNFEQKQIVEGLLHHPNENTLTFDEAQTYAINKAMEIVHENHNYRMNNISPEWFYESILLKYPSVVFQYRSWFENIPTDIVPNGTDMIKLKQWQIALMLHAQLNAEHQKESNQI